MLAMLAMLAANSILTAPVFRRGRPSFAAVRCRLCRPPDPHHWGGLHGWHDIMIADFWFDFPFGRTVRVNAAPKHSPAAAAAATVRSWDEVRRRPAARVIGQMESLEEVGVMKRI